MPDATNAAPAFESLLRAETGGSADSLRNTARAAGEQRTTPDGTPLIFPVPASFWYRMISPGTPPRNHDLFSGDETSASNANLDRASGLTIQHKLLSLQLLTIVPIVGFLGWYFPSRQIDDMRQALERKTRTYAQLVAQQVRSAVAFDDRETARETFDALAQDPIVSSIVLFQQDGNVLHAYGTPTAAAIAAKHGVTEAKLFTLSDRMLAVTPVVSLEGPRGTLALELSTQSLAAAAHRVQTTAITAGVLALIVGLLSAWLIARSIARRIRVIAGAAARAAAGDLDQAPIPSRSHDEIGIMAVAFNTMLSQLRDLIAQIQRTAEEEQERLERMVVERTQALRQRNQDMRLVLDNINQGLLTIDRDGVMTGECSDALISWLGQPPANQTTLWDYISRWAPEKKEEFELGWSEVTAGLLPLSLTLEQMPEQFEAHSRCFAVSYQPIGDDDEYFERMLIVITDITDERERNRAQQEAHEFAQVFSHVLRDRVGFLEFFAEAHELVRFLSARQGSTTDLCRATHTLKGNAAIFGIQSIVGLCHRIEDHMKEFQSWPADLLSALASRWDDISRKLTHLLGEDDVGRIELGDEDYHDILRAIRDGVPRPRIAEMVEAWTLEPMAKRLERIAKQIHGLATRLDKEPVEVKIEHNRVRLDQEFFSDFWTAFAHAVRNSVDHGLETPEERAQLGKPGPARVTLRTIISPHEFRIELEDNGRGINWDKIKARAQAVGLAHTKHDDLITALFTDGVSSKDHITEMSGRGVGMAALRAACIALNGQIAVDSCQGEYTKFTFVWTSHELTNREVTSLQPPGRHAPVAVGLQLQPSLWPNAPSTPPAKENSV